MATDAQENASVEPQIPLEEGEIDELATSLANADVQDNSSPDSQDEEEPSRPLHIYTRKQLVTLSQSPLVKVPDGMPELKDWFGTENESNMNKKDDASLPGSGRERRPYKREGEDADVPTRPSFRGGMSQPSQMGNFKHQSIRSSDRDNDREGLRSLSDKYDRDRLGLPLTGLRGKDRDVAPHLATGAGSSRVSQPAGLNGVAGRREPREPTKKKAGEEDWRRGSDTRKNRDGDREERPRSRVRESSRSRRDPSTSRRENRRERERDEEDSEDPRRWRDDGKRDERLARRARDKPSDREPADRWTVVEDKDTRTKRNSGRDRKAAGDDPERREKQKEQEPAWMDTYVPTSTSGILGGKTSDGELDGIQAWKKNMKEKEQKERDKDLAAAGGLPKGRSAGAEGVDEIQMFKMMMKKEQTQDDGESMQQNGATSATEASRVEQPSSASVSVQDNGVSNQAAPTSQSLLSILKESTRPSPSSNNDPIIERAPSSRFFPKPVSQHEQPQYSNEPSPISPDHIPQGSRLLALANRGVPKPGFEQNGGIGMGPGKSVPTAHDVAFGQADLRRSSPGFSPFEEQHRLYQSDERQIAAAYEAARRGGFPNDMNNDPVYSDPAAATFAAGKGSRLAKFFDNKQRDVHSPNNPNVIGPSHSPGPGPRPSSGFGQSAPPGQRTVDDLYAMLNGSQRPGPGPRQGSAGIPGGASNAAYGQAHNQLLALQQQQQQHLANSRINNEPLYESRMDNRNFVPDGMVPGLRPAPPPPRNREYDGLDETMLYNAQRLQAQAQAQAQAQHRGLDDYYSSSNGGVYQQQQLARNASLGVSPAPYRGGPSPIGGQHAHLQQRLPPGLANLGGRPPLVHEPSPQQSYLGGLPNGPAGLHNAHLHNNGLPQHQYNNFNGSAGNGGMGGGAQLRALGGGPQMAEHLPQHLPHGLPNNLDLRNASQAQLLGHARAGGNFGQQHQSVAQLQALAMRQQQLQQQQLMQQQQQQQSHMHQQAQHQQQHHAPHPSSQASDLMALLMGGGPHRD